MLECTMILYRYFNLAYALEALQTGTWKVGRFDELNDIYDCRPFLANIPSGLKGFEDTYLKIVSGFLGVVCYSKTINDPVIWSHYSDSHRGVALGFDYWSTDEELPNKVSYSTTRPLLDFKRIGTALEDQEPAVAIAKLVNDGFMTKHPSWQYEQEYRSFAHLDNCQMIGVHYFQPINLYRLRKIVLGAKCMVTMQDIERIALRIEEGLRDRNGELADPPIEIIQCKMNPSSFDLEFDRQPRVPQ